MAVPTKQKALLLMGHAGAYEVAEIDVPQPDADEVLVRVEATALNPSEWKGRFLPEYASFFKEFPIVQGSDAAGTIVAVGDQVTKVKVGDEMYVFVYRDCHEYAD